VAPGEPFTDEEAATRSIGTAGVVLAQQDGTGVTGQTNALRWNEENGLGGFETWGYGPDVEANRAADAVATALRQTAASGGSAAAAHR
jgi:hypothetical protein